MSGDDRLSTLFADYWDAQMRNDPTWATYLGDHRFDSLLTDHSDSAHASRLAETQAFLARLEAIPTDGLSPADQLNYQLFERELRDAADGAAFRDHLMPLTQQGSPPTSFAELPTYHPLNTVADIENYTARLRAFPRLTEQVIANMKIGMDEGLVSARITIDKVIPQIEGLITRDPAKHILAEPAERLPEDLPAADRERLSREIIRAVRDEVIPAYRGLNRFIRDRYLRVCRNEPGIWALPDGAERYAYAVRSFATTDMTPEEVMELGRREVGLIKGTMRRLTREMRYRGDLQDFMDALRVNPRFYHDSPDSLMLGFREILQKMDKKLPLLFGRLPVQWYDLREIEAYRAPSAPAAYYYGAPDDGSRPAYFYVNTYRPETRPKYTMEALAYHEAVPGHHLQLTLQQEMDGLPEFRRHGGFTAFVEGWALYSERLPKEIGFYGDLYSEFGRLTFEVWRAVRLVVDTGIHHFKWTREEAIEYFKQNTSLSEVDIISEVERYIAWPGQALAYKIGQLRILDIRAHVERELGEDFDVRQFHDELLAEGALPLDLLENRMTRWTSAQVTANWRARREAEKK